MIKRVVNTLKLSKSLALRGGLALSLSLGGSALGGYANPPHAYAAEPSAHPDSPTDEQTHPHGEHNKHAAEHTEQDGDQHDHSHGLSELNKAEFMIGEAVRAEDMEAAYHHLKHWLRLGGNPDGMIFMGIILRHVAFTRLLIAEGANLNATAQGMYKEVPALQVAILEEEEALALLLITAGADLNQRDAEGNTALMQAAVAGQTRVVEALLKAKANPRATNKAGYTALERMNRNLQRARLSQRMSQQYQRIMSLLDEAELHIQKGTTLS